MSPRIQLLFRGALIVLSSISIIASLSKGPAEDCKRNHGLLTEEYEPSYFLKFQRINDVIDTANAHFKLGDRNSLKYYDFVAEIIRKRFYHGYSHYSLAENPLIFAAGKVWDDLSAIVIPDDIMKHPMAACSQQAIVLMEIFKRNGTDFRKIGFTHHYTVEAKIERDWRYFDTDMEPDFRNKRESLNTLLVTKRFDTAYKCAVPNVAEFHKLLGKPRYGKVNKAPAPRATFIQQLGLFLVSNYFLFSALILMIFSSMRIPVNRLLKKPIRNVYSPVLFNVADTNNEYKPDN